MGQQPQQVDSVNLTPFSNHVSVVLEPKNNTGGIYLGGIFGAMNYNNLQQLGIGAVLTVAAGTNLTYPSHMDHLVIEADDTSGYELARYFEECYQFIEKNLKRTNILVHCYAGISRSASILISYFMKKCKLTFEEGFAYLKSKRKIVSPNPGFRKQLIEYQMVLTASFAKENNILTTPKRTASAQMTSPQRCKSPLVENRSPNNNYYSSPNKGFYASPSKAGVENLSLNQSPKASQFLPMTPLSSVNRENYIEQNRNINYASPRKMENQENNILKQSTTFIMSPQNYSPLIMRQSQYMNEVPRNEPLMMGDQFLRYSIPGAFYG